MKQRAAATTRRPRGTTGLHSKVVIGESGEPMARAQLSAEELLHETDALEAAPEVSMAEEARVGLDFPGPEHRTLGREDADVRELSEADNLVGVKLPEFEEEEATRVADLVLMYLQEAGAIALLTPADEARLSMQMQHAKVRLMEILRTWLPVGPEAGRPGAERWRAERLQQVQPWMSRVDHDAAAVQQDSGLSNVQLHQLGAELQPWQQALEEA